MPLRRPVLVLLFLIYWSLTTHGKFSVTGDEPHYLIVAQSLAFDRDLDVGNNYQQNEGALFGASGLQREQHAQAARDGRMLPVHDIGVPVVLLPVYVAAIEIAKLPPAGILKSFRMNQGLLAYAIISLFIMAIVIAAAHMTIAGLVPIGLAERTASILVLVIWASAPVLSNAFLVFPEPFALFVTAWSVRMWTAAPRPWSRHDSVHIGALGLLPWFHRKFVVYAVALLLVTLWHRRRQFSALGRGARVSQLALFAAPVVALAAWTFYYWGNFAGPLAMEGAPLSLAAFADGAPGLLIDRENGLFWWAPAYILVPAAWSLSPAPLPWLLPVAALFVPAASHYQWWGGFSPAARFLVPLVPIFCAAGVALVRCAATRSTAVALLIPQLLIAAYGWQHPRLLWPRGDGHNRVLGALLDTIGFGERWVPSFRVPSQATWPDAAIVLAVIAVVNGVLAGRCLAARRSSKT